MDTSFSDFQKDVIEASKATPIVVDFWAEWCAPCRTLGPVLEKLAEEAKEKWKLVKVNTEEHPQLAMEWGIQGIPAVKMFYNGEVKAEFVGVLPEYQIRKWLDKNIPTESKKILEEAKEAMLNKDKSRAQKLLQQAIGKDSDNYDARILLAELIFESDPEKAFRLVENAPREHPFFEKADSIRTLHHLLNSYTDLSKTAEESDSNKLASDCYLKGMRALQDHDYEEAIKNWIEVIQIDPELDDDGARKACVALFNLLGNDHDLSKKYHRAFSSALF